MCKCIGKFAVLMSCMIMSIVLISCGGGGGSSTVVFNFTEVENVTPDIVSGTWKGTGVDSDGDKGALTLVLNLNGSTISGTAVVIDEDGDEEYGDLSGNLVNNDLIFGSAFGGSFDCSYEYTANIFTNENRTIYIMRGNYHSTEGDCDSGTFEVTKQ